MHRKTMDFNAAHYLSLSEAREFLESGLFMAWNHELWLLAWGCPQWSQEPKAQGPQFFLPDFFLSEKPQWLEFPHVEWVARKQLRGILEQIPLQELKPRSWDPPPEKVFRKQFSIIQGKIQNGEIKKAVPVVFECSVGPLKSSERLWCLKSLTQMFEGLMPYGFWAGEEGLIGASPEILFDFDLVQGRLSSMAVAGTRRNRQPPNVLAALEMATDTQSLMEDPKERYEHSLVVDEIEKRLSSMGEVRRGNTFEWSLGPLKHLRADIEVRLNHIPDSGAQLFREICDLLHPTPALGVSSGRISWKWLGELGSHVPRNRYGAPFGVVLPTGQARALVAIRNVQWFDGNTYLGSGCGVVPQSVEDSEWKELHLKRESVKEALGLL